MRVYVCVHAHAHTEDWLYIHQISSFKCLTIRGQQLLGNFGLLPFKEQLNLDNILLLKELKNHILHHFK